MRDDLSTLASLGVKSQYDWIENEDSEKEQQILECLHNPSEKVDLWQLREYALSPGGLLNPSLRKSAWPKLLACHELMWGSQCQSVVVEPQRIDVLNLQHEVSKTIWNIQDMIAASKQKQELKQKELDALYKQKRVKFASPIVTRTNSEDTTKSTPPQTIATSPSEDDDDESIVSQMNEDATVHTQGTNFTASTRVIRWRKASIQEQKILFNVVISVLRASPHNHYFSGLQDLAAILVINLESPSLASLVLNRIAQYHLQESFQKSYYSGSAYTRAVFPLLESVDSALHQHLHTAGLSEASFSRQWISCWFSQDIPDVGAASRLIDVLLVSHPLMPVYLTVAMLQIQRSRILNCEASPSILYAVLRGIAAAAPENMEDVIRLALRNMKRLSPETLTHRVRNLTGVSFSYETPSWVHAATAPTDYGALQLAKEYRETGSVTVTKEKVKKVQYSYYPMATMASGIKRGGSIGRRILSVLLVLAVAYLLAPDELPSTSIVVQPAKFLIKQPKRLPLWLPTHEIERRTAYALPSSASNSVIGVAESSSTDSGNGVLVYTIQTFHPRAIFGRLKRKIGRMWKTIWSKVKKNDS